MLISSGVGEVEEEEQPSINLLGQPESKTQSPPPPEEDEQEVPRTGLKLRRVTDLPGTFALSRNMSAQYDKEVEYCGLKLRRSFFSCSCFCSCGKERGGKGERLEAAKVGRGRQTSKGREQEEEGIGKQTEAQGDFEWQTQPEVQGGRDFLRGGQVQWGPCTSGDLVQGEDGGTQPQ